MLDLKYIESKLPKGLLEAVAFNPNEDDNDEYIDIHDNKDNEENKKEKYVKEFSSITSFSEASYDEVMDDYINTMIENQHKLSEYSDTLFDETYILEDNRIQDEARFKWDKIIRFADIEIKKFNNNINKILGQSQQFLKLYKNILLNNKWRSDQNYVYNGDYKVAIDRCMNSRLPEFSYEVYGPAIREEGYEAIMKRMMAGKSFNFDKDDNNIQNQLKRFFLALDRGQSNGVFSDLNAQEIYNFCSNPNNLTTNLNADLETLKRTQNAIIVAVDRIMRSKGEDPNKPNNPMSNPQPQNTATPNTGINTSTGGSTTTNVNASAIIDANGHWIVEDTNNNDNINTNLKISVSTIANREQNQNDNENPPERIKATTTSQDIDNIITKWSTLNKAFIMGKIMALQKISKDYMMILQLAARGLQNKPIYNTNNNTNQQQNNQPNNNIR